MGSLGALASENTIDNESQMGSLGALASENAIDYEASLREIGLALAAETTNSDMENPRKRYKTENLDRKFLNINNNNIPKLSSELFLSDAQSETDVAPDLKRRSKHSSKMLRPFKGGLRKFLPSKKREAFTSELAFFNSWHLAEETLQKSQEQALAPKFSLPRKMNFRGRRRLRKTIRLALDAKEDIILHASFFGDIKQNVNNSIVMDSGSTLHIGRDKSDFKMISGHTVRIRGVTGLGLGHRGLLKESAIGYNIEAIWYPELPVKMLVSATALVRDGWKTVFDAEKDGGNHCYDKRTGKIIPMVNSSGLPCLEVSFDDVPRDSEQGYAAHIVENHDEWDLLCQYCNEPVPKNLEASLHDTKPEKRACEDATPTTNAKHPNNPPSQVRKVSKLLEHQRWCHMFVNPNTRCRCFDCLEMKTRKSSHAVERNERYDIRKPFLMFSCDFFGAVKPKSFRGNSWVLVYCCDSCGYARAQPIKAKSDAPASLEKFVKEIRQKCGVKPGCRTTEKGHIIFAGIHSDNEPVLRGEPWRQAVRRSGLQELHSAPFCPQQNGTCERMVGTIKSSLRTTMHNVDPKVWDYCVQHLTKVWNIKVSKKASKHSRTKDKPCCPEDIMEEVTDNPFFKSGISKQQYLRRFGCLAFFKRDVGPDGTTDLKNNVLRPRAAKGIHLGFCHANSSWLIGTINKEGRFATYETRDVVFIESILVRDIEKLCASHISLPVVWTNEQDLGRIPLSDRTIPSAGGSLATPVGESESVGLQGLERALERSGGEKDELSLDESVVMGKSEEDHPDELIIEDDEPTSSPVELLQSHIERIDAQEQIQRSTPCEDRAELQQTDRDPGLVEEFEIEHPEPVHSKGRTEATSETSDGEPTFGQPVERRRRGRPCGTKDTKKRLRRTKKQVEEDKDNSLDSFCTVEIPTNVFHANSIIPEEYAYLACTEEDDEDSTEVEVFLARDDGFKPSKAGDSVKPAWAFRDGNPERPSWVEAKTKEHTRILSYDTWRKLSQEEELEWKAGRLKAVPCALLLNRKRCGRYKARLVVLGNRWHPDGENSVYASVVSQTGNRAVVTHCAREGFHIVPFDISNAFIRADMGDIKVVVSLPESFRDGPDDNGRRMLKKALYGLPISPRLWAKTLARDLQSLGWEECKSEPGVYRKWDKDHKEVVAYITVYVDDCIVGAKTKELVEAEVELVNAKHPLTRIQTKTDNDGTMHFDMCGADIDYNPYKRSLKISMSNYIDKILTRFDMVGCKVRPVPGFPEENLYQAKSLPSQFKFKAAVGALQWLATTARPDIAHSTNTLARAGANPVTKSMEKCARYIFKYLAGTKEIGLEYSPQIEKEFHLVYDLLHGHEDNNMMPAEQIKKPVTLFTDASFGVAYKTLRSITGVCVYLHGMPIAWKTKVQTIHTSSTTESEWVALADGIEFSQSVYGLQRFLTGRPEIADNEGAIMQDNKPVVINARRGEEGTEEIPKKTRHIALRYARVLEHAKRIWFVPTDLQLADGLTKSVHRNPLLQIFTRNPEPSVDMTEEEWSEDLDFSDCFFSERLYPRKEIKSFAQFIDLYKK